MERCCTGGGSMSLIRAVALAVLCAFFLVAAGCAVLPPTDDYGDLPLPEAVEATLVRLESAYAFTEHKQLDWEAAHAGLMPLAEAATTAEEHDEVVRRLVPLLPDAHVQLYTNDAERDLCRPLRGTLGLTLSDVEDGSVIVAGVTAGGPAEAAGLLAGDVVVSLGGVSVEQAVLDAPLWCHPVGTATPERRRQVRVRMLGRAETDALVGMEVLRDGEPTSADVLAEPDDLTVQQVLGIVPPETLLERRMLTETVGYVRIGWEEPLRVEVKLQAALLWLERQGATSLVIDLRGNDGGMERTAANIAGYFTDETQFYETVTFYDGRTGGQRVMSEVWVQPQEVRWHYPVEVLVSAETVSSGEGTAMLLSRLDGVEIMGFEGTAASFGSTGSGILLPDGWRLDYPGGRSLDVNGQIQLDSDAEGVGGVLPEVRVPWTPETRVALAGGADPVLDAAVARLEVSR